MKSFLLNLLSTLLAIVILYAIIWFVEYKGSLFDVEGNIAKWSGLSRFVFVLGILLSLLSLALGVIKLIESKTYPAKEA